METIEAIYEHGAFRVVAPPELTLAEGQRVRLVVQPILQPKDILALAARVYEGLTDEEIDFIEQHSRRRKDFFDEGASA